MTTATALNGPEQVRFQKFSIAIGIHDDPETEDAMEALFEITKMGCCEAAHELMRVCHSEGQKASARTMSVFKGTGLIRGDSTPPERVRFAVRKAVELSYLNMEDDIELALKPDPRALDLH
ncbi:MAG: hypothetical protein H6861_01905 [Rhodospirillales bacterium]|nr:hypothetical protein [Rhodospirillales bacterium]